MGWGVGVISSSKGNGGGNRREQKPLPGGNEKSFSQSFERELRSKGDDKRMAKSGTQHWDAKLTLGGGSASATSGWGYWRK